MLFSATIDDEGTIAAGAANDVRLDGSTYSAVAFWYGTPRVAYGTKPLLLPLPYVPPPVPVAGNIPENMANGAVAVKKPVGRKVATKPKLPVPVDLDSGARPVAGPFGDDPVIAGGAELINEVSSAEYGVPCLGLKKLLD